MTTSPLNTRILIEVPASAHGWRLQFVANGVAHGVNLLGAAAYLWVPASDIYSFELLDPDGNLRSSLLVYVPTSEVTLRLENLFQIDPDTLVVTRSLS